MALEEFTGCCCRSRGLWVPSSVPACAPQKVIYLCVISGERSWRKSWNHRRCRFFVRLTVLPIDDVGERTMRWVSRSRFASNNLILRASKNHQSSWQWPSSSFRSVVCTSGKRGLEVVVGAVTGWWLPAWPAHYYQARYCKVRHWYYGRIDRQTPLFDDGKYPACHHTVAAMMMRTFYRGTQKKTPNRLEFIVIVFSSFLKMTGFLTKKPLY